MTNCKRYLLGLMLFGFSYTAYSQNTTTEEYFRHFQIQVKNLSQEEFRSLQNQAKSDSVFEVLEYCSSASSILLRVSANHPKRVEEIQSEIKELVSEEVAKRRIIEVKHISYQDQFNFCK